MPSRHQTRRGTSPILGTVLMVALAVILAALVSSTTLGHTALTGPPMASAGTDETYNTTTGQYVVTAEAVSLNRADYLIVKPESDVTYFKHATTRVTDDDIMYRDVLNETECSLGPCIEWAEGDDASDGKALYELGVPDNDGNVTVTARFAARSYSQSGAALYAVDASGDRHVLACDGELDGTMSEPADLKATAFQCLDRGPEYTFDDTYTVASDTPIVAVRLATDVQNIDGEWSGARAQFTSLSVENDSGVQTTACIPCHANTSTTSTVGYEGVNHAAVSPGDTLTVRGLAAGETISVIGSHDGERSVITTRVVGE